MFLNKKDRWIEKCLDKKIDEQKDVINTKLQYYKERGIETRKIDRQKDSNRHKEGKKDR